jgi:hypothetical protein
MNSLYWTKYDQMYLLHDSNHNKKIFEQKPDTAAQTAALPHHVSVDTYLDYSKIGDTRYSSRSQCPLKDNWN